MYVYIIIIYYSTIKLYIKSLVKIAMHLIYIRHIGKWKPSTMCDRNPECYKASKHFHQCPIASCTSPIPSNHF